MRAGWYELKEVVKAKQGNWLDDPCWYATVRDAGRAALLLGPFRREEDCRQWAYSEQTDGGDSYKHMQLIAAAEQVDNRAWFFSYGMAKVPNGYKEGRLNEFFNHKGDTFEVRDVTYDQIETQTGKEQAMSSKSRKSKIAAGRKVKAAEKKIKTESKSEGQVLAEEANKERKSNLLEVSRKDAVDILKTSGFKMPQKCDNEVLARRLGKLKTYMESYEGTLDADTQDLVDRIIKAGPGGITIVGEEPRGAKKDAGKGKGTKPAGKGKKAPEGKKATVKKSKKRIDCICDAIKNLPKSGKTMENVAAAADEDYVKAGGDSNVKQTAHHIQVLLPALLAFNVVAMKDDKMVPAA